MTHNLQIVAIGFGSSEANFKTKLREYLFARGFECKIEVVRLMSFDWQPETFTGRQDLALVVIADYDEDHPFLEVLAGLDKLAEILAAHPNHPDVCVLRNEYLLNVELALKKAGTEARVGTDAAKMLLDRLQHPAQESALQ